MNSAVAGVVFIGLWILLQLAMLLDAWRAGMPAHRRVRHRRLARHSWTLFWMWLALTAATAVVNLDSWYDLRETDYGQALLVQLWAAGAVLAATACFRWLLAPALRSAEPTAAGWRSLPLWWSLQLALLATLFTASLPVASAPLPLKDVQRFVVRMEDYRFVPDRIDVAVDRPVRLVAVNQGGVIHDLVLQGTQHRNERLFVGMFGYYDEDLEALCSVDPETLHVKLFPGTSVVLEFIPEQTGTFSMVCTVARHKARGMVGEFVVHDGDAAGPVYAQK